MKRTKIYPTYEVLFPKGEKRPYLETKTDEGWRLDIASKSGRTFSRYHETRGGARLHAWFIYLTQPVYSITLVNQHKEFWGKVKGIG